MEVFSTATGTGSGGGVTSIIAGTGISVSGATGAVTITNTAAGSSAFNSLTSGTNTTAAMVVGTGATLAATGSGAITATAAPLTGLTGLGAGVSTFLATPTSANLASAVTDETGSGALVFGTNPTISIGSGGSISATGTGTVVATSLTSLAADPADSGVIRLGNAELIEWEANPTGTDLTLSVNTSNLFAFSAGLTTPGQYTSSVATGTAPLVVASTTLVANLHAATADAAPASGLTGLGTGVATALGVNVGSAGAFVTFNGALGTPSSGTLTSATGLPVSTGITGLGTGVATALAVNVGSAGAFVTFNGALGTPSSGTLTSATGLPISTGVTGLGTGVVTLLGNNSSGTGGPAGTIAPTITGTLTLGDATTPALLLATGKTNTGNITIQGKTSGSFILQPVDALAQNLTLQPMAQTGGAASALIVDLGGTSRHFAFYDMNQTWFNAQTFSTSARASGVAPYLTVTAAADTGQTAATEAIGVSFLGATRQHASNTTVATQREIVFAAPTYSFASATGTITNASTVAIVAAPILGTNAAITNPYALWIQSGNIAQAGKTALYNNVATAGWGQPAVYGAGSATGQTAANASIAAYTVGAADGDFIVSANVLVTASVTHAFTCTCAYTDEGNTARTITFTFSNVGGTLATSIANTGGTVPYEGVPLHIRAKATTAITIATAAGGTYTSVTYNARGVIQQIQ